MSFTYQTIQDCISNAINALHGGNYSNFMVAMQALGVFAKTIYQRF